MEKRLGRKVDEHFVGMKQNIQSWMRDNNVKCVNDDNTDLTSDLLKYIYDMEGLEITKEDFQKRKRIKNIVPHNIRCIAKRANCEQCTRRRLDGEQFCGTHIKGTPHGIMDIKNKEEEEVKKVKVWIEEIMGINYYIDDSNNVYDHEDILTNKSNPNIIGKWEINAEGTYIIPEFMN